MYVRIGLLFWVSLIVACSGTRTLVHDSYVHSPDDRFQIEIMNSASATVAGLSVFETQLATHNVALQVGAPNANRKVTIEFTKYYVRHGAARAIAGVMAGSDTISTLTTVKDAVTGELLGSVEHTTRNPNAFVGINVLIRDHANKVANFLLSNEQ